ncbi:MAG: hypothetical protein Rhirs2KO_21860 [Rhizobiaceae bacterium]
MIETPLLLRRLERILDALAVASAVAGSLALAVLAAVTVIGVFWRYVLRDPIFGIEDVATMALTVTVAGAIAWGSRRGAHVSVNVIGWAGGRGLTRITDIAARLVSFVILALATYALFQKGACGIACGAMTSNLGILHKPFFYARGVGLGIYAAVTLMHLMIGLAHWAGEDPNEVAE